MIQLKKFLKEDYKTLISWVESPEMLIQFAGPAFSFPLTIKQLEQELHNPKRYAFSIIENDNDTIIGHAQILEKENTFLLGRILIANPHFRGKGLGQLIVKELLSFGTQNFDKKNAELNVYDWNISAIKCYEKIGFIINPGIKNSVEINGKTWVSINMLYKINH